MIYAGDADTTTMGRMIDCTASTGEGPAARFLLDVCCGNIINAPNARYNGMEYIAIIIGLIVGAILNYYTRRNGHP